MNQLQTNDELVRDSDYYKKQDSGCQKSQVDFNSKSYNCTKPRVGFLAKEITMGQLVHCVCVSLWARVQVHMDST